MPTRPVSIQGTLFLADLVEEVADEFGFEKDKVERHTSLGWVDPKKSRFPVIEIQIMYASFVFVAPRYVWKWSSLEQIVYPDRDSVYDIDFDEMYMHVTEKSMDPNTPSMYRESVDFTSLDETTDWVVEKNLRHKIEEDFVL